jgi:type II secretory pathway component GspD/PulD (secretin)
MGVAMCNYRCKILYSFFIVIALILIFQCNAVSQDIPISGSSDSLNQQFLGSGAIKTSKNVTLMVEDMDILSVLNMLAMKSGLNIVVGKNVTGKVTIFLRDVNAWDALQIILLANNFACDKQGDIINVMTDKEYELVYGEKFDDKKKVYIAKLKHAKAVDVSKVLMQVKTNIGKVILDEGSNTIVMMDTPSSILQMIQILEEIDGPLFGRTRESTRKNMQKQENIQQKNSKVSIKAEKEKPLIEEKKIVLRTDVEKAAVNQASASQGSDSDYFQSMKHKIQNIAAANASDANLKGDCTVKFTVDSDGNLINQPVIVKESSKEIGDLVFESVKSASPFGSFPKEFDVQNENFTLSVFFQ